MGVEGRPGWREVGGPMITSVEGTFSHIEYVSPVWPAGQGPRAQLQDVATKKSMTHGKGVALLPNKTPDTTFGYIASNVHGKDPYSDTLGNGIGCGLPADRGAWMSNSAGLGAATEAIVRSERLWMKNTGAQPQRKWNAEDDDEGERGGMKVTLLRPRPEVQGGEEEHVEVLRPMSAPEEGRGQGGGGGGEEGEGGGGGEAGGEFEATWLSGGESRRFHHDNFEKVLKEKETQRTIQGEHASRLQIRNSVGDPLAKSLALEIDSREADLSAPGTLDGRGGDLLVAPRSVEVGERWEPGLYGPSDLPFRSRIIHGRVIKEVMPEALLPPPKEQQQQQQQQQQHEPFLEDDAKTANDATVEELVSLSVDPVLAEEALGATKGGGIVEAIRWILESGKDEGLVGAAWGAGGKSVAGKGKQVRVDENAQDVDAGALFMAGKRVDADERPQDAFSKGQRLAEGNQVMRVHAAEAEMEGNNFGKSDYQPNWGGGSEADKAREADRVDDVVASAAGNKDGHASISVAPVASSSVDGGGDAPVAPSRPPTQASINGGGDAPVAPSRPPTQASINGGGDAPVAPSRPGTAQYLPPASPIFPRTPRLNTARSVACAGSATRPATGASASSSTNGGEGFYSANVNARPTPPRTPRTPRMASAFSGSRVGSRDGSRGAGGDAASVLSRVSTATATTVVSQGEVPLHLRAHMQGASCRMLHDEAPHRLSLRMFPRESRSPIEWEGESHDAQVRGLPAIGSPGGGVGGGGGGGPLFPRVDIVRKSNTALTMLQHLAQSRWSDLELALFECDVAHRDPKSRLGMSKGHRAPKPGQARFGVRSGSSGWMKRSELPLVLRRFSVFLPDGGADELLEEIGAPAVRGEIDYRTLLNHLRGWVSGPGSSSRSGSRPATSGGALEGRNGTPRSKGAGRSSRSVEEAVSRARSAAMMREGAFKSLTQHSRPASSSSSVAARSV